jgi:hypothetical protein
MPKKLLLLNKGFLSNLKQPITVYLRWLFFNYKGSFLLLFLIVLSIFAFYEINIHLAKKKSQDFSRHIQKCNFEPKEARFSCYRSSIEKFFKDDLDEFYSHVENSNNLTFTNEDRSYAIFGTNCHTFYHAVGDYIASNTKGLPLDSAINYCPKTCTSGCVMGLYKRKALQNSFATDLLKDFFTHCRDGEKHQCSHEIGHLLHDKYVSSILTILDNISFTKYGLKPSEEYKYVTFQKADVNAPFEECKKIVSEKELPYCFTGVGHNLFLFAEFSPEGYKSQFNECDKVESSNKDNCYGFLLFRIGINDAAPRFIVDQYNEGNEVCNKAVILIQREDLKYHCYLGLGGGIGLFADSEYPSSKLITEKNLDKTKGQLLNFATMCEKSENEFIDECFSGLLGTRFKEMYKKLELKYSEIEKILPAVEDEGFQVVG